jgi:flagellar protein FliO/FliZ
MMLEYFLRLLILVPLIGGLAWGSLWLWKRLQLGLPAQRPASRPARVVDVVPMGTAGRLAVVEFSGRTLLVAASRQSITLLAEAEGDFADA